MSQPRRILQVVWSLAPGGLERVACQLARCTADLGVSHAMVCLHGGGSFEALLPKGTPVTVAGTSGDDLAGAAAIHQAARRFEADAIHAHNWACWPAGALAGIRSGLPVVWTLHGWDTDRPMSRKRRLACHWLAKATSAMTAVSRE